MKAIICLDKHEGKVGQNAHQVTCAIESVYHQLMADYLDEEVNHNFDKKTLRYAIKTLQSQLYIHGIMSLFLEVEDDDFWNENICTKCNDAEQFQINHYKPPIY